MAGVIYLKTKHCSGLSFRQTQPFWRHHQGAGAPSEVLVPHTGDLGCPGLMAIPTLPSALQGHGKGHGGLGSIARFLPQILSLQGEHLSCSVLTHPVPSSEMGAAQQGGTGEHSSKPLFFHPTSVLVPVQAQAVNS